MLEKVYQYQQQARYYYRSNNKFHFNPSLGFKKPSTVQHRCYLQTFFSMRGADLQAALDKH
jgi:hypothetical protein